MSFYASHVKSACTLVLHCANQCPVFRSQRSHVSWRPLVKSGVQCKKRKRAAAYRSESDRSDHNTGGSQEAQPSNDEITTASEHDIPEENMHPGTTTDPETVDWREFRYSRTAVDRPFWKHSATCTHTGACMPLNTSSQFTTLCSASYCPLSDAICTPYVKPTSDHVHHKTRSCVN